MIDRLVGYAGSLGKLRDALLILGGVLFGLGYATSATFSWLNRLPPVPYEKTHYFVIGAAPLALALGVAGVIYWAASFQASKGALDRASQGQLRVRLAVGALVTLAGAVWGGWLGVRNPHWFLLLAIVASVACSVAMAATAAQRRVNSRSVEKVGRRTVALATVLLAVGTSILVTQLYIAVVLVWLPQELGGLAHRRAQLDIATSELSEATLAQLAGTPAGAHADRVLRSRPVEIVYLTDEVLVVVPRNEDSTGTPVLTVPRAVVRSIAWCE